MAMIQLIYVSAAREEFDDAVLDEILRSSVTHNGPQNVTGMLLYFKGGFMQVLEGDETAVDETYARIGKDARHHDVTLLSREPIILREFAYWSMGFRRLTPEDAELVLGYAPFFSAGFDAAAFGMHPGTALGLLKRFVQI